MIGRLAKSYHCHSGEMNQTKKASQTSPSLAVLVRQGDKLVKGESRNRAVVGGNISKIFEIKAAVDRSRERIEESKVGQLANRSYRFKV